MPAEEPAQNAPAPFGSTRLVGGVNFSLWPDLKWARANTHYTALQARLVEWQASLPIVIEGILHDDRKGIDLINRVPRGVPREEWSLTIGDALHNLRSALDAVAWGLAHHGGARPKDPRSVTFPICTTESQWQGALGKWISGIDPEFQSRLLAVQPFKSVPEGETAALSMLHDLDIQDKHKDFVAVRPELHGVKLDVLFEYEDDTDATPRAEIRNGARLADGDKLGTIFGGARIKPLEEKILFRPTVQVLLEHKGREHDVAAVLPILFNETRRCLDIVMGGSASVPLDDSNSEPLEVLPVND